jgi:hypothetical protein
LASRRSASIVCTTESIANTELDAITPIAVEPLTTDGGETGERTTTVAERPE